VTFEIGIEGLRSPAAKTVNLQLFPPFNLTLTLILTGLGVPTMEGVVSGFASAKETVVSRSVRVTVWAKTGLMVPKNPNRKLTDIMRTANSFIRSSHSKIVSQYNV